ncbi:MAG TPA: TRAP transporter large permease subunit [Dehalococcoidia bacterium]|jgi:tripartite ATP-independent transporter DctM subunit|nr:TRAP transporter large permease subunit [Dehalococcoidia bacterium]
MIELSPEIITVLMLGGLLIGVLTGFPVAFVIGAVALPFGFLIWGDTVAQLLYGRIFMIVKNYILLAVPLFVFMGLMLERSGITEKLYDALYLWLGGFRGGLAITTVLIGTILAACVGIIAASVTMLSIIAVPHMVKRGYSKSLASGATCAGGTLGILIPPSVMLVFYGPMAEISVGKLFFAAFPAGLLLSTLYCGYIALHSLIQPEVAPAVPIEERAVPFLKKTVMLLTSLVPPVILILAVLGTIFFGIAAPTEAAGVGAFVATLLALAYRKLNWRVLKEVGRDTVRTCGMIFLFVVMSVAFVGVFIGGGGGKVVSAFILASPFGKWGAFAVIMFITFILGMFIDWMGIVLIMVPIITPIAEALGFHELWFAMMICVNLQMSFMTPPYAPAIFIARGAIPPDLGVTTADIIRGITPFVLLVVVALGLFVIFPEILLWLPAQMIK